MKIVLNSVIPFKGYIAMAFFNIIFWRKDKKGIMSNITYFNKTINHEQIHEAQMLDFCPLIIVGGIIFYIIYILEWLYRLLFTKDFMSHNAYRNLSFEREAYDNEDNLTYINNRKKFSQWK